MSRRHSWLTFTTTGPPIPHALAEYSGYAGAAPFSATHGGEASDPDAHGIPASARGWQEALHALHSRWYAVDAPPQVAAAFVLQWLLQVPAHTAAHAAASGPWRADLTRLRFALSPALVPSEVRLSGLVPDAGSLDERLGHAERDYRAVATPLATAYDSLVRLGPHTRVAMVDDMWVAARREAESAAGVLRPGVAPRGSCCLLYALPGCTECAGCPRLRPASGTLGP